MAGNSTLPQGCRTHDVPQVNTRLSWHDILGTVRARLGFWRDAYAVTPGLYAVGTPDATAPVLVTAKDTLINDKSSLSEAPFDF